MTNATSSPLSISREAWVSLGIFLLLLVAVIATREDQVSEGVRVMNLEKPKKDDVIRIELSGKHTAIVEKVDGKWLVSDPAKPEDKFPVGEAPINNALDSMETLEIGSFVTGRGDKHAELDIDKEKGQNVKIVEAGGRALHVVFGRSGKGGGNYIRFDGQDDVFLAKGRLSGALRKDVKGWRESKLFYDSPDELASIEVQRPGKDAISLVTYEVAEGEETKVKYKLKEGTVLPEGFRLDEPSLRRLASSVTSLRALDFGAKGAGADVTGFGGDNAKVVVNTKKGATVTVEIGKANEKDQFHVQKSGDEQIYLLPKNSIDRLLVDIDSFRDLKLATHDANLVVRASFVGSKSRVEVKKDETSGSWVLASSSSPPEGFEFDENVLSKLTQLASVRATKFLGNAPFAPRNPKIELFFADGSKKTMVFGDQMPKKDEKSPELYYARGLVDGFTYGVAKWGKDRYDDPLTIFKKVAAPAAPPGGMGGAPGGMPGGMQGLDSLPPEIREKLMKQMQQQGMPQQ